MVGEIIWGLKFKSSQMCHLWSGILGRRDYLGLIFLVSHCPSHFLSIKLFLETGQLIIWGLEKVGLIIWRSEKIAQHQHPHSKSQGVTPLGADLTSKTQSNMRDIVQHGRF